MTRNPMVRTFATTTALACVVTMVAAIPSAAAPKSSSTLSVRPATNLVADEAVEVHGDGFPTRGSIAVVECRAGAIDVSGCDLGSITWATTDDAGAFTTSYTVRTTINTATGQVDCTIDPQTCAIGAANPSDIAGTGVSTPISFDPGAAPGPPVVGTVTGPTTGRIGTNPAYQLTGWASSALLHVGFCAPGAPTPWDACSSEFDVRADGNGSADITVRLAASLWGWGPASVTDCSTAPPQCAITVADSRALDQPATLPVAVAPRPIGTVSTPPADIHDGDTVTLTGSGWQPYSVLELEECGPNWCAYLGSAETDIDGAFSTTVTAVGAIPGPSWFDDCSATPQACRFVAIDGESPDPSTAQAGVAFTVDSTPDTVASQYSLDGSAAVHAAAERLQLSDTEYQRIATWVTMFLLGLTGGHEVPHLSGAGTAASVTTQYPHAEFPYVSAAAGRYDDSTASFQRDASLVVAQIVAQWPR